MKGVMFVEQGQAEIIEEPAPACRDDAMLLRCLYSGVSNGTERSFLVGGNYGAGSPWPKRLSYQHVSEVVECGRGITRYQPGDTVFSSTFPGHVEYLVVKESDLVVRLPDAMDRIEATMLGVASVAYHDARVGRVTDGDRALVIGDGLIGQFAAQAARLMGAHVTLSGHHEDRLGIARELGADVVIDSTSDAGEAAIDAGAPYAVILECSGGDVLGRILGSEGKGPLVGRRSRARLVMVAGRHDVLYDFNAAGAAEIEVLHTNHFDQEELEAVLGHVSRGSIRVRPLIRDVVPFEDAPRIFDTMRDHPRQLLGTVFEMPS
ncbi:zinc-binding dehydrogenase [Candidatus Poribacteria bacterium]|jgi:bacteriochlorophyllide a dehydrogenase|nr:zinc-binding dehydrogenase [Candidatus Poribacteria bacterium]MBT5532302.1 zinc-binding dehydrogenase [Candidatus Poribacteria bacterium]MBT5715181.1 zinc-binding dehydrogenase [Candidatus Poribacteria bacterium]MBT7097812.1 zinc-binding dehydrogenase [Candidatus Poribacteria bacterium]MBT7803847.1 zinc-binding dehydrogenase [Candidatus Poribacteria bacterium]